MLIEAAIKDLEWETSAKNQFLNKNKMPMSWNRLKT